MIRFSLERKEEFGLTAHAGSDDPFFTEISNYVVKHNEKTSKPRTGWIFF